MLNIVYIMLIILLFLIIVYFVFLIKNQFFKTNHRKSLLENKDIPYKNNTQEILDVSLDILCQSVCELYKNKNKPENKMCCTNLQIVKLSFDNVITSNMIIDEMKKRYNISIDNIYFEYHNCFYPNEKTLCISVKFN